jgi:hypothetical protein
MADDTHTPGPVAKRAYVAPCIESSQAFERFALSCTGTLDGQCEARFAQSGRVALRPKGTFPSGCTSLQACSISAANQS